MGSGLSVIVVITFDKDYFSEGVVRDEVIRVGNYCTVEFTYYIWPTGN